jgi:predicted Zn-dependent protease
MRKLAVMMLSCVILIAPMSASQVRSVTDQLTLGIELAKEFESRVTLSSDPATLALVNRVGQILTRNSEASYPVTFQVIDSSDVNVSVLMGGFVYVTTGLIAASSTEAELASTLAYGIAHYSPKFDRNPYGFGSLSGRSTLLQEPTPQPPIPVSMLGGFDPMGVGRWSNEVRIAVEKADRVALQYVYRAGYDPMAYVTFLQSLETRSAPVKVALQTHPRLKDRIKKIQEWSRRDLPPRPDNAVTTAEFDRVRRNLQ